MKRKSQIFFVLMLVALFSGCSSVTESIATAIPTTSSPAQSNFTDAPSLVPTDMRPEQVYETIKSAVVEIQTFDENGNALKLGTGFFINDHGEIITNFHVINEAFSATVLYDAVSYSVTTVIDYNVQSDLAKIAIDLSGNEWLKIENGDVSTGEHVYALGSSLGLTNTFSDGIISNSNFVLDGVKYIQTTAPISQGNSGGPLVNAQGKVIGVNTWGIDEGQNINFAVAIEEISQLTDNKNLSVSCLGDSVPCATSLGSGHNMFKLEVTFLDGSVSTYSIYTDCETVGESLYELGIIDGSMSEYGFYVDTVFGEKLDYTTSRNYWALYVNGELPLQDIFEIPVLESNSFSFVASHG